MKILIVEDEIIPANYLKKLLQKEAYEVVEIIKSGEEAIRVAKEREIDLILMDVILQGGISGCDAALKIRQDNPKIFIVFLTAYSDKEMVNFAADSKAFGYLLKPYRDQEILATLQMAKRRLSDLGEEKDEIYKDSNKVFLIDDFCFDKNLCSLTKNGDEILLGPIALHLISMLCMNKNQTLKIESILEELWEKPKSQQALRSLIFRIREKTVTQLIINVNKLGYKIALKKST